MNNNDIKYAECNVAASEGAAVAELDVIHISLTVSVSDREALWDAAAAKALAMPGMRLSDVVDVIGPREEPEVADCIAMLTQPAALPGCALSCFDVDVVRPEAPLAGELQAA